MNRKDERLENILDRALDDIRNDSPDPKVATSAADRVWARLSDEMHEIDAGRPEKATIRSCDDYQGLIPAYFEGKLSEARRLLLEDHSRECLPCRKALKQARSGRRSNLVRPATASRPRRRIWSRDLSWGLAAAVLVGVTLVGLAFKSDLFTFSTGGWIRVENVDGDLFQVSEILTTPAVAGEIFSDGESIRTGKDSGATFTLEDGSRVEMNQRSELYVTRRGDDQTIHLTRGDVIVEAAPQGDGRLFVDTGDAEVEVKGTVFAVRNGTKGSRVSVIEGEVHVHQGRDLDVLQAGDQVTTSDAVESIPVADDIAWSKNLDEHLALLREFAEFQQELEDRLPEPERRYSTRLLDSAPENTVVYVAFPNLTTTLSEAYDLLQEKIGTSEPLRNWWENSVVASGAAPELEQAIEKVRQFGDQLGDELVLTLQSGIAGGVESDGLVLLSTLRDPGKFRSLLTAEIERLATESEHAGELRIVDDPFAEPAAKADGRNDEVLFMIQGDLVVVAPRAGDLRHMASLLGAPEASRFVGSPLHEKLAQAYRQGTGILFGADLETILRNGTTDPEDDAFRTLGLSDVRHLIVERHDAGDTNVTRATLSFSQERRGVASWLAEPAPMGSLEFISPDAMVASAFVVRTPATLLEELFTAVSENSDDFRAELERFRAEYGVDPVEDIAGPLGGEFAVALDGPILPKPAWKAVMEVYDPEGLQRTLDWAVERLNEFARDEGRAGFRTEVTESGGRTYHALISEDFGFAVHYTFVDGYFLAASQKAMIDRALQLRASGITLASSRRFNDLLPRDTRTNFSAVLYQNLGKLLDAIADNGMTKSLPLTPQQQEGVRALAQFSKPSVFAAYGEAESIEVVGADRGSLLFGTNVGRLFDVGSILNFHDVLDEAAHDAHGGVYDGDRDEDIVTVGVEREAS